MAALHQFEFVFETPDRALEFVRRATFVHRDSIAFFRTDKMVRVYDSTEKSVRESLFMIADILGCVNKTVLIIES